MDNPDTLMVLDPVNTLCQRSDKTTYEAQKMSNKDPMYKNKSEGDPQYLRRVNSFV